MKKYIVKLNIALFFYLLSSCMSIIVKENIKNSAKVSSNNSYYIVIEPSEYEKNRVTNDNDVCKRERVSISQYIYNFLNKEGIREEIAQDDDFKKSLQIAGEKGYNFMILPTLNAWSDIGFVLQHCHIPQSNIHYYDAAAINILIYDVSNKKYVDSYSFFGGNGSNWVIGAIEPKKYLDKALKKWWQTQK